jgi:hypothetical protein
LLPTSTPASWLAAMTGASGGLPVWALGPLTASPLSLAGRRTFLEVR